MSPGDRVIAGAPWLLERGSLDFGGLFAGYGLAAPGWGVFVVVEGFAVGGFAFDFGGVLGHDHDGVDLECVAFDLGAVFDHTWG